jgi:[ribosomal protein S18]-alanine N-acetyltransferase
MNAEWDFRFTPMTESAAQAIVTWLYAKPYDIYNVDLEERESTVRGLLDPVNRYFAAWLLEELAGFACFGPDARVPGGDYIDECIVDVGLGLRPDLTGKGIGLPFVNAIVAFATKEDRPQKLRLTVAVFNQRAIRVYERAGFRFGGSFAGHLPGQGPDYWIQMIRSVTEAGDS